MCRVEGVCIRRGCQVGRSLHMELMPRRTHFLITSHSPVYGRVQCEGLVTSSLSHHRHTRVTRCSSPCVDHSCDPYIVRWKEFANADVRWQECAYADIGWEEFAYAITAGEPIQAGLRLNPEHNAEKNRIPTPARAIFAYAASPKRRVARCASEWITAFSLRSMLSWGFGSSG